MSAEMVVCTACGAVNRVPSDRLSAHPNCGRCGKPLFGDGPAAVEGPIFERLVSKSTLPVVVDFWASWCGPCRMMAPAFEAAAAALETSVVFTKVDTETAQDIAGRYAIRSIPTLILFRGGREIDRQSGAMNERSIVQWITASLASA